MRAAQSAKYGMKSTGDVMHGLSAERRQRFRAGARMAA
jgi:hypothetical protein